MGKVFLDCTYEGDLMAASGVNYTVGREGNDRYNETLNGVKTALAKKESVCKQEWTPFGVQEIH